MISLELALGRPDNIVSKIWRRPAVRDFVKTHFSPVFNVKSATFQSGHVFGHFRRCFAPQSGMSNVALENEL